MHDALVGVLAQHIRGSSASIVASARTLERHDGQLAAEQRAEFLRRVSEDASRLGGLAGNLLAISRLTTPESPAGALTDVVQQVLSDVADRRERRRVRCHVASGLRTQMGADALHTVLYNLLTNALRFAAPGSRVDLIAGARAGQTVVDVCNVGPPILPADQARVFEPFVAGVTEGDPRPGFGFGLYAVRTLVEAHDGEVEVASRGGAVRFSVCLPAAAHVQRRERTVTPPGPAFRSAW